MGGNRGFPHKNRQPWVPATSFLFCVRWATRPNCQPLTLSHLESDGGPTASMPSAARPHCILAARNSETLTLFSNFERKHYVQVRRNYGRQPSNQLRGAQGASAHACSTGLSTGHHLMPMKALCGAASQCRGATTVRQLQTRGELWEAAGCVEHTERVQLQWHCEGVDENSAASACEGVDENARAWTKTRGNPDSCTNASSG